jgi:hypothetical protein
MLMDEEKAKHKANQRRQKLKGTAQQVRWRAATTLRLSHIWL